MDSIVQCFVFCFIFLCLTTASFSTQTGKNRVWYAGDSMVVEGDPFNITCYVTVFEGIKWQKDGQTINYEPDDNYGLVVGDSTDGVVRYSSLSSPSAQMLHSGNYRCNSFTNQSQQLYVLSASSDPGGKTYVFLGYKSKSIFMECQIKTSTQLMIKWSKNDKIIDFDDLENKDHYKVENIGEESKLTINHPTDKDIGNYSCQLHNPQGTPNGTAVALNMINYFEVLSELTLRMDASVTVIEGEELKLRCLVSSKSPPDHIFWQFGNETYETSRDRVELKEDEKHNPNAIFSIKEAVAEDRGSYTCLAFATSIANATKAETYVRVKDKLAALWPFLGICAEVFVLCAIILIYEKKRNKAELEESDTDQSPDQQKKSSGK